MYSRLILATGLLAATAHATVPVSKLAAEWLVPHGTDPQKASLIDSASGTVRTVVMQPVGTVVWRSPVATGVTHVSDVCGAVPAASGEAVALTSIEVNRVMLVNIDAATPVARVMPNLSGIGPSGLALTVTGGASELMVLSSQNGSIAGLAETHANIPTTANLTASKADPLAYNSLQPLANPAAPANMVGFYSAASGADTATGVLVRSGAAVNRYSQTTHSGAFRFTPAVRTVDGAASIPLILGHRPGTNVATLIRVNTPVTTAGTFTDTSVNFAYPVSAVVPLRNGGYGPLTDGFLAIAADGTRADWIRINASGNALVSTSQSFTPSSGLSLTGIIPMTGSGLMRLEGSPANGPSASFKAFQWDGSNWTQTASGNLPGIDTTSLLPASLLFFNADPAADESAALIGIQAVADWTRPLSYPAPFPLTVMRETFASSAGGLAFAAVQPVSAPPGASYVMTNQPEAGLSITALGGTNDLLTPELEINPLSGPCSHSIQVTALYDAERQELLWRDAASGPWNAWAGPLAVCYSRSLQFSLRSIATGTRGPIVTRSYTFAAADIADEDSDGDGVPDYVEAACGLDAFGGPDHDSDGWSDLDELIVGTNPDDPLSSPAIGTSKNIAVGGGFRLAASARNHQGTEIADAEEILAHATDGSLLAREAVATFAIPLPDGAIRGAILNTDTPVPADQLVALATPLYFNITSGTRSGRELRAFIPSPEPVTFSPAFSPAGSSLSADAAGWVAAAQSAAASLPVAASRTVVTPADTAVAVLLEELVQRALIAARPVSDPAPALDAFTFFPARDSDRTLTPPAAGDAELLRGSGFDLRSGLNLATAARSAMSDAAHQIYQRHAAASESEPGILVPLDALRSFLRGGSTPAGYEGAVGTPELNSARNAYLLAIANAASSYRPMQTWTVEVLETPPSQGIYRRTSDSANIALLDRSGARITLDQGFGLMPGTRFSVTGFTDTPDTGSTDTMEVMAASLTFAPASSDNDTDGNLLDDEWEKFFFGSTGQDPLSEPSPGYSLLQYFLDGVDPRGAETPDGPPVSLAPSDAALTRAGGGSYYFEFSFPQAYAAYYEFALEESTTLVAGSFSEISSAVFSLVGTDRYRATISAGEAADPKGFYRVRVSLR